MLCCYDIVFGATLASMFFDSFCLSCYVGSGKKKPIVAGASVSILLLRSAMYGSGSAPPLRRIIGKRSVISPLLDGGGAVYGIVTTYTDLCDCLNCEHCCIHSYNPFTHFC
jgi:hypothetical protein